PPGARSAPVVWRSSCRVRPGAARATLFPYTTLFRSSKCGTKRLYEFVEGLVIAFKERACLITPPMKYNAISERPAYSSPANRFLDRKSTRLNSSHVKSSYAVFCLQQKRQSPAHRAER